MKKTGDQLEPLGFGLGSRMMVSTNIAAQGMLGLAGGDSGASTAVTAEQHLQIVGSSGPN